jgi:hypothetical protein
LIWLICGIAVRDVHNLRRAKGSTVGALDFFKDPSIDKPHNIPASGWVRYLKF